MRNVEIVELAKAVNGISEETTVHTLPEWNRLGKKITKGQHPVFNAKIWKPRKQKTEDDEVDEEESTTKFIKVWAGFYTEAQVE